MSRIESAAVRAGNAAEVRAGNAAAEALRRQAELDASFDAFFTDCYLRIERFLRGVCADRGLVEDATQEAFIIAREKWAVVSQFDAPLMWVRKTARYRLRDLWREQTRHAGVSIDAVPQQLLIEPTCPREAEEALLDLLRRLPPRQAAVFALAHDGYSDEEIGWELDLAVSTVRSYKAEARRRLKRLAEDGDDPTAASGRRT